MMQFDAPDNLKSTALGMRKSDRVRFAEFCSRDAKEPMQVASAEQIVAAEHQTIIEPFLPGAKNNGKTTKQVQRRRKNASTWSAVTELVGFKLPKPDDPILQQFQKADDDSRPLRLVIAH